ncbi:tyrosine-type recombinase/integrase [Homoserinimonas sp. A520]
MARPALEIGTYGKITTRIDEVTGRHIARAKFCDQDGVVRQVTRSGESKGAAERALKGALVARKDLGTTGELTREDRLSKLLTMWWEWKLNHTGRQLASSTISDYEDVITKTILPGIGQLKIRELTVGRLDQFLIATRERSTNAADLAKTILKQSLDRAAQLDVIETNPAVSVTKPWKAPPDPEVLTTEELALMRSALRNMRQKNTYLPMMFELQLAFSLRIGEALAIDWADVHLDSDPPTVKIHATLARARNTVFRQPHTKSGPDGARTLIAPAWVVEMLREHKSKSSGEGLVLRARGGGMVMPSNARESWRNIRERVGLGWVTPHHMRKTSLTRIEAVYSDTEAASFAGQKGTAVLHLHYIPRDREGLRPDVRLALDALAPQGTRGTALDGGDALS